MFRKLVRILSPLLGVLIFVGALFMLQTALRHYRYRDVVSAIHSLPRAQLVAALFLTLCNYLVLTLYDTLGLRYVRKSTLPYPRIALASFIGYSFSQNLGWPLFTGAPIRYRLYSVWGLSAIEITNIVVFNSITFFLGMFALGAIIFIVEPVAIPGLLHLPFKSAQPLGLIFLLLLIAYLLFGALNKRPLRIFGWEFPLPNARLALLQIAIASADWTLAGSVFYAVLKPAHMSYPAVMAVFLLAQMAGLASHIPAGLGVFEVVVLYFLTPAIPTATLLGAIVAYRGIYYLLPLLVGSMLLAMHEFLQRREHVRRFARAFGRWTPVLAPQVLAFATFVTGALLMFSAATPTERYRLHLFNHYVPLGVMEASHFLASMAGLGLLLLGRALQRRLDAAYQFTVGLLCAGIFFSILKGGDYEEAIALVILLSAVMPSRRYFYRRTTLTHEPFTPGWIGAVAVVVLASIWLGQFSFKHVEYSDQLWWQFALNEDAPRFLRATFGVLVVLLVISARRLLRAVPAEPTTPTIGELERAAAVVWSSPHTSSNLALLGDKSLLFSESGRSFIAYAVMGRTWIAMGDPAGAEDEKTELIWDLRHLAERHDGWPVFYQVRSDNLPIYLDIDLTLLKIGEEARVDLSAFAASVQYSNMKEAAERAEKDGFTFSVIEDGPESLMADLARVSDVWLAEKNIHEKRFASSYFNEQYLKQYPVALLRHGSSVVAFANLWCSGQKLEMAIDILRYTSSAPENILDLMFGQTMAWGSARGYSYYDLGLAPLTGIENRALAPFWQRVGPLAFKHGEHFYSLSAIRQYKDRFDPDWEPRYIAAPGGLQLPRVLTNIGELISD